MKSIKDNYVFAWHTDAKQEFIDKAIEIGNTTIDGINTLFEKVKILLKQSRQPSDHILLDFQLMVSPTVPK